MTRLQTVCLSLIALTLAAFAWASSNAVVYLPIVALAPSFTPTFTPTITPTPTNTATARPLLPCAASNGSSSQFFASRGVQGNAFRLVSTCVMPNEDVWFEFKATNNGSYQYVGGLGAWWCTDKPGQCNQASWGDFWFDNTIGGNPQDPHNVITWNDHLNIATSGVYQVRLGICWLANRPSCMQNPGSWEALSNTVTLTVR